MFKQLIKSIKDNKLGYSNYLLFGEENFFIDQIEAAFTQNIISDSEKLFNQKILYGKEVDVFDLISLLKSFPMTGKKQLIIIREAHKLDRINEMAQYFSQPVESTILVLCFKSKNIDKRKKWVKLFQKTGLLFESKKVFPGQISKWINYTLSSNGIKIQQDAEALLLDFLGFDLSKIHNAAKKLSLVVSNNLIKISDVQEHIGVHREYNNFELQNAIAEKNVQKIFKIVYYFTTNKNKFPYPPILGLLVSFFSKLLCIHGLNSRSEKHISEVIKIHPYFVSSYISASQKYSFQDCVRIIALLRVSDLKFKGVGGAAQYPLEELMVNILYE